MSMTCALAIERNTGNFKKWRDNSVRDARIWIIKQYTANRDAADLIHVCDFKGFRSATFPASSALSASARRAYGLSWDIAVAKYTGPTGQRLPSECSAHLVAYIPANKTST
jgi:hypothetical protein